jgi:glycosyltransferase involved in cell wall biosynthesis
MNKIIAIVRTRNEEKNIARYCGQHDFADEILVADGGSTDNTVAIANIYFKVTVRQFTEELELEKGYLYNPEDKHLNFLIEWAEERGADWIVMDDCDTNPNYALRRDARMFMKLAGLCSKIYPKGYVGIQAPQVFLWENNQWFPEMEAQKYWAWRADLGIRAYGERHGYMLKALAEGDWGIGADGIFFDFDKNDTIDLTFPYCRIHTTWETAEEAKSKEKKYRESGLDPYCQLPTKFAGEPAPREKWIRYEN